MLPVLFFFAAALAASFAASLADSPSPVPSGTQTPCAWLKERREGGATLPELVDLARSQADLFTRADLRCLERADFHARVLEAARGKGRPAPPPAPSLAAPAPVPRIDVTFRGLLLSPAHAGGRAWDGEERVSSSQLQSLQAGVPASPQPAAAFRDLLGAVKRAGPEGSAAPDVVAVARVQGADAPAGWETLGLSLARPGDGGPGGYAPTLAGRPGFVGLAPEGTIDVEVWDQDWGQAEEVGRFSLSLADLATLAPGPWGIPLAEPTGGRILAVEVEVGPSQASAPGLRGALVAMDPSP